MIAVAVLAIFNLWVFFKIDDKDKEEKMLEVEIRKAKLRRKLVELEPDK